MQLFVRGAGPGGSTASVDVLHSDTVLLVKHRLSERTRGGRPDLMRLLHAGRQLQDACTVASLGLLPWSTLQLTSRLRGGGGDGGSTGAESRSCYLEMYAGKKKLKVNPAEELLARWTRCRLSNELLSPPCVIDELGTLFNKDAVVTALLHKSLPAELAHITSLKNLTAVKLERAKQGAAAGTSKATRQDSFQPSNEAEFCCPVTGVAFSGRFKFVVHRATGIAVSEKAIKEAPAVVEDLLGGKWKQDDLIQINPVDEQLASMRGALLARMAAEQQKKAAKKAKKGAATAAAAVADGQQVNGAGGGEGSPEAAAAAVAGQKRSSPAGGEARRSQSPGPNRRGAPAAGPAPAAAADTNGSKRQRGENGSAVPKPAAAPKGATASVYASLFTSSVKGPQKETYCCRSTGARGNHLT